MLPPRGQLRVCFAHPAYQLAPRFALRESAITHLQVHTVQELADELPRADVLVVSLLWKNDLVRLANRLKFIQAIGAGIDQFDQALLAARGVRLANAAGVSAQAVAEHAMALMLALARHLHTGRDNQANMHWRGMISDTSLREQELGGKTLLIIGLGQIGARLAKLAKAFGMRVVAVRRDVSRGAPNDVDSVGGHDQIPALLPSADVIVLTCPLTPDTENLIDASALAAMKPSAHLINVARGRIVDEDALIEALRAGRLAAAALDVTREEPLPQASPLWTMPNVLITPHKAGETQRTEDGVIDILLDNIERLWRGETALRNQIV
jgi:phosphoglycerate dehydrogenase-like enzyme